MAHEHVTCGDMDQECSRSSRDPTLEEGYGEGQEGEGKGQEEGEIKDEEEPESNCKKGLYSILELLIRDMYMSYLEIKNNYPCRYHYAMTYCMSITRHVSVICPHNFKIPVIMSNL